MASNPVISAAMVNIQKNVGTTVAAVLPQVTPGDLLFASFVYPLAGTATPPNGWTLYATLSTAGGHKQTLYVKIAQEGESAGTWTSSSSGSLTITMAAVNAGDVTIYTSSPPTHKESDATNSTNKTTVTAGSVTPTIDNCTVLLLYGTSHVAGSSHTYVAAAGSTGVTPTILAQDVQTNASAPVRGACVAFDNLGTAAATGTRVMNITMSGPAAGGDLSVFLLCIAPPQVPALSGSTLNIIYGTDSDTDQQIDIYQPTNANNQLAPYPVLPWTSGNAWGLPSRAITANTIVPYLQSKGIIVVMCSHRRRSVTAWPAQAKDHGAIKRWLKANIAAFNGDPKRILAGGHSSGAHDALVGALAPGRPELTDTTFNASQSENVIGVIGISPHCDSRGVDPQFVRLGITRSSGSACGGAGGPEQFALGTDATPIDPCTLASYNWIAGDGGSLDASSWNTYNRFSTGFVIQQTSVSPKPFVYIAHGSIDDSIPWIQSSNTGAYGGSGHALDQGIYERLQSAGWTANNNLLFYPNDGSNSGLGTGSTLSAGHSFTTADWTTNGSNGTFVKNFADAFVTSVRSYSTAGRHQVFPRVYARSRQRL